MPRMLRPLEFAKRADRRKDLMEKRLPRGIELPPSKYRPTVTSLKRVRIEGYDHAFELRSSNVLGAWRAWHYDPDGNRVELTTQPVEFESAWQFILEVAASVRERATTQSPTATAV